ncbi:cytochrome b5-like heme/steroid binding domain-containing protein [Lipomyces kononenkoae]|uniref:Cytochrome b5-like heme/steroid binding domain-containing protein n=1 Tax=Lipomyces kononenkoae TaxID=34357 RepID=A0ACC3T635_LIPKO
MTDLTFIQSYYSLIASSPYSRFIPYLNAFLAILSVYLIYKTIFPPTNPNGQVLNAQQQAKQNPKPIVFTKFTPATLQPFNGVVEERVLMAIKGRVYDVSAGRSFYGPGGPYSNFAGRDASRGLAKGSFDEDMLTAIDEPIDTLDDLTVDEIEALKDWERHFASKYLLCGELVEVL